MAGVYVYPLSGSVKGKFCMHACRSTPGYVVVVTGIKIDNACHNIIKRLWLYILLL